MAKLEWDKTGERQYEVGVDHGVIYPYDSESAAYAAGEAWNGLISVSESPEGADLTDFWADIPEKIYTATAAMPISCCSVSWMHWRGRAIWSWFPYREAWQAMPSRVPPKRW